MPRMMTIAKSCFKSLQVFPLDIDRLIFLTVVAIADPAGQVDVVDGALSGEITEQVQGSQGFGYDPVFLLPDIGKTLAEVTLDYKNTISHRALALQKAKTLLKTKWIPHIQSGRSAAR